MACPFLPINPEENYTLEIFVGLWALFAFGSSLTIIDWLIFLQIATLALVAYIVYYLIHKDIGKDSIPESLEEVKEMVDSPEPSPKEEKEMTTEFSDILSRNNAT